jgi:AhpD family alkylhydroperoxidase
MPLKKGIPMSREKLQDLTRTRKWAHQKLIEKGSGVYKAFLELEKAAFSDGVLKKREKELIAIGISVRINCESCMQWHIEQAAAAGASYDEVLEAVEVGIEMGGGPATVSARLALQVMEEVYEK